MFRYHVHDDNGDLIAGVTQAGDACMLLDTREGGSIRAPSGNVLWQEGAEVQSVRRDYDYAERVMKERECRSRYSC